MDRPILFTVGPVEMYGETLAIEARQTPYQRLPDFSGMFLEAEALIRELTLAGEDAKVIVLTASGTGAMEALVMNALTGDDKALLIRGGTFGAKFAEILACHGIPFDAIDLAFNEALTPEHLAPYDSGGYSALLVNIHETGSGQLYDTRMLSDFCRRNDMLFLVDAISSFCADEVDMRRYGIHALIFSSQKALALSPGISVVVLSGELYEKRIRGKKVRSVYFAFNDYVENAVRGQTPYTAAVKTIYTMRAALADVKDTGIENKIEGTRRIAEKFRKDVLARGWPMALPSFTMSNALTTLIFDDVDAMELFVRLRNEYGFIVTPSGGALSSRTLRIGHIGNMKPEYYDGLLAAFGDILGGRD